MKFIVVAAFCLLAIGCSGPERSGKQSIAKSATKHVTKKKYNAEGNVISIQEFLKNDTGLLADGPFTDYYDDGAVKSTGAYKMGKFNGFVKNYYPNGCLLHKLHFFDDSAIGGQYEYYDNGVIKSYYFHATSNAIRFSIQFDENGKIIKNQIIGKPLSLLVIEEKPVYDSADSLILNLIIAKPEHIKTKLTVLYQRPNKNYKVEITDKNYNYFAFANMHYSRFPYICIVGSGKVTATLSLYDSVTNKLITADSVKYNVIVKQ